ncbi:MAG TPA: glycerol-3-phosphate dehydrogenase C-terminal domain-containing protein, partial [Pyrinomonadaceae bacterium]
DLVFRTLGKTPPPCPTAEAPLPGAAVEDFGAFRRDFQARSTLAPRSTARLLRVYGARAAEVLRLAQTDAELSGVVSEETGSIGAEVVYAFREELAETLADCLMRRTMLGLNGRVGLDALERAARLARKFLGWDEGRASCEVEAYRSYVGRFHPTPG